MLTLINHSSLVTARHPPTHTTIVTMVPWHNVRHNAWYSHPSQKQQRYHKMIGEGMAAFAIAGLTGLCVAGTQLHKRITTLDNRLDDISLKIAEKYVTRNELSETFKRFEDHLVRIENKMDTCFTNK